MLIRYVCFGTFTDVVFVCREVVCARNRKECGKEGSKRDWLKEGIRRREGEEREKERKEKGKEKGKKKEGARAKGSMGGAKNGCSGE